MATDLIDLDRAKQAIPNFPSADDAVLQSIISAASTFTVGYLGRDLLEGDYSEVHNSDGDGVLLLRQFPVILVSRIACDPRPVLSVQFVGSGQRAQVRVSDSAVLLTSVSSGVTTNTTKTFAANPTLAAIAAAIGAVSGWTAAVADTAYNLFAAADLTEVGGFEAKQAPARLTAWTDSLGDYDVNAEVGEVYMRRGSWGPRRSVYRAEYTAGYETLPEDLSQAVAELCQVVYGQRRVKGPFQSETIGQYSYQRGTVQAAFDLLSPVAKQTLALYRCLRIGRQAPI